MTDAIGRFEATKGATFDIVKTRDTLFNDWYKTLLNICLSMFDYDGLPETIPKRDLEFQLLQNGYSAITKANNNLYAFNGGLGGVLDTYYLPTLITIANPYLKFNKVLEIGKDCILMLNDKMYNGMNVYISKYASLLTSLDISFYWGIIDTRVQKLYEAKNDTVAESIKEVLDGVELGFEIKTIAGKSLFDLLKVHETTNGAVSTNSLKALIETRQYILAQFFIGIGLNANYNMKRESLNENELNADSDTLLPLIDTMLECREEAVEQINSKYGTNISVQLSKRWRDIRRSLDAMLKEQEVQADEPKEDAAVEDMPKESGDSNE